MSKILIIEGLCPWNGYVRKRLAEENYEIRTASSLRSIWPQLEEFQPDLVLINLGGHPGPGWQLFRQVKSYDAEQALLNYHVVNSKEVEDVVRAVKEALHEVETKNIVRHLAKNYWNAPPIQIAV